MTNSPSSSSGTGKKWANSSDQISALDVLVGAASARSAAEINPSILSQKFTQLRSESRLRFSVPSTGFGVLAELRKRSRIFTADDRKYSSSPLSTIPSNATFPSATNTVLNIEDGLDSTVKLRAAHILK